MSVFFTLKEFQYSRTAEENEIENVLPEELMGAALFTLAGLERVRWVLMHPMTLSSGYRCPELNRHPKIGGVEDSQHTKAEASDFICPGFGTPKEIYDKLTPLRFILGIDQLILEASWVHVSFTLNPRYQAIVLT